MPLPPKPSTQALHRARLVCSLVAALGSTGCSDRRAAELTLQVGPDQLLRIAPITAYAQYFELPGRGDVLRIVLSSYEAPCKTYVPPQEGDVYISVTVHVEDGTPLTGSDWAWDGTVPRLFAVADESSPKQDNDEPEVVNWALPFVRLAEDARPLPPGGYIRIARFSREPYGQVEGEFHFSDAGEGEAATAALMGPFQAQLCHVELDPARSGGTRDADEERRDAKH